MKIPIVKIRNWVRYVTRLFFAFAILAFVPIFVSGPLETIGIKSNYVTLILICSAAVCYAIQVVMKTHDTIGYLLVTKDNSLKLQMITDWAEIGNSSIVKLNISNYDGQLRGNLVWATFSSSFSKHENGLGNYIYARHENTTSKLEILVKTEYIYNRLR